MSVGLTSRRALVRARPLAAVTLMTCGLLALASAPAFATGSGVISSISTQPASTGAGTDPDVTSTTQFVAGDSTSSAKNMTVTLPPGLLAAPAAVPQTCSSAQLTSNTCPAQSVIGGGAATVTFDGNGGTVTGAVVALYLMPAQNAATDVGALGVSITAAGNTLTGTGTLRVVTVNGQPTIQLQATNLPNAVGSTGLHLDALTLRFNGKAADANGVPNNGAAFIRLPTNCSTAATTISVDTYSATNAGTGTDSFTPTGCASLPYSPSVTVSATKDADSGVSLSANVTQPAGQAATQSVVLNIPSGLLTPNASAASSLLCNSPAPYTGCPTIGTASGTTPLLSGTLSGSVYLVGPLSLTAQKIAAVLPPPFGLEIDGTANLTNNTVTFSNLPDVPLSSLNITLKSSPEAFTTTCTPASGTGTGTATGQGGQVFNASVPITIAGCPTGGTATATPGPPTATPLALGGLGKGKAALKFKLAAGSNGAPKIKSFKVKLPSGLSFIAKAFAGKKLAKAISVAGGGKFTASVSGGALVVKLKTAASKLTVSIRSSALSVSKALRKSAAKHKVAALKVTVLVTDAQSKTTALTLSFKKPS